MDVAGTQDRKVQESILEYISVIPKSGITISKCDKLGEGTFGTCYVGIYKQMYDVCVKVMKKKRVSLPRLHKEATILNTLSGHNNIPHCFGICLIENAIVTSLHTIDGNPSTMDELIASNAPPSLVSRLPVCFFKK